MALFSFERTLEVLASRNLKDEEDPRWN
jgi:hypothetical protein